MTEESQPESDHTNSVSKDKTITIKLTKTRLWQIISGILAIAFIISIATGGFSLDGKSTITQPTQQRPVQAAPTVVDVSEDDDPAKGNENAPVTIIEFSDFQCPYCGRFYRDTLPQLTRDYIDTGKVKLIFRDLPLAFHSNAQKAAEAAECADDQSKFWEMHDKIFENQNAIAVSDLKGYASQLGMDSSKFNECLDSGSKASEVQNDLRDANAAGATGTPTFFINGKKLVGAQPFSTFKQIIDSEL